VLNQLTALRARRDRHSLGKPRRIPHISGSREQAGFTVQVTTREQITPAVLRLKPTVLYVPLHLLTQDKNWTMALLQRARVCPVLPRIIHDGEIPKLKEQLLALRELGIRDALVGNYGHIIPVRECGLRCRGDFGLNLYNSGAVAAAAELELRSATLSFEMTLPQLRDVSKPIPCELLVYGRLPLMVTENCLIRGRTGECTCHQGAAKLMDKTGAEFPIIKDGDSCRSILLNGKKLYWLDRQEDLNKLNLWAMRLCFTTENAKEVDQVIAACHKPAPFDPGACTRGLYLRGIE
jgi:putative protease